MENTLLPESKRCFESEIGNLSEAIQSFIISYNKNEGFNKKAICFLKQINMTIDRIREILDAETDETKRRNNIGILNSILSSFNEQIERLIFGEFYINSYISVGDDLVIPTIQEINRILRVKRAYPAVMLLGELMAFCGFIYCLPGIVSIVADTLFKVIVGTIMFLGFSAAFVYLSCIVYTGMVEKINNSAQSFSYFISKRTRYIEEFAKFFQKFSRSRADLRMTEGLKYLERCFEGQKEGEPLKNVHCLIRRESGSVEIPIHIKRERKPKNGG